MGIRLACVLLEVEGDLHFEGVLLVCHFVHVGLPTVS